MTPEERKVVTVIFADLSGSTEMATRLDPEDLRGVLRPFFDAMVEEIERFGGTVEKFIGDAVMAVFGVPVAHEDDEERAVRAAFAMQARMEALNREVTERAGGDLDLRVGINTGEVLAAHSSHREGYVTGEVVNVAARLQTVAESGAVVVGQRTHDATDATIAYRDLGPFELKGIDEPVAVYEALPDRPPRRHATAGRTDGGARRRARSPAARGGSGAEAGQTGPRDARRPAGDREEPPRERVPRRSRRRRGARHGRPRSVPPL